MIVVGVDVHKQSLTAVAVDEVGRLCCCSARPPEEPLSVGHQSSDKGSGGSARSLGDTNLRRTSNWLGRYEPNANYDPGRSPPRSCRCGDRCSCTRKSGSRRRTCESQLGNSGHRPSSGMQVRREALFFVPARRTRSAGFSRIRSKERCRVSLWKEGPVSGSNCPRGSTSSSKRKTAQELRLAFWILSVSLSANRASRTWSSRTRVRSSNRRAQLKALLQALVPRSTSRAARTSSRSFLYPQFDHLTGQCTARIELARRLRDRRREGDHRRQASSGPCDPHRGAGVAGVRGGEGELLDLAPPAVARSRRRARLPHSSFFQSSLTISLAAAWRRRPGG